MRIIIAPAKKMAEDTDSFAADSLPAFLEQTERLMEVLQGMSPEALRALWKCNDAIARQNVERLEHMDLRRGLTPAILAYEGIQYRYMAPGVMETAHLDYLREHLRILSGFYGLLQPFDGVVPYRLEMQARLAVDGCRDLYQFWGGRLARAMESAPFGKETVAEAESLSRRCGLVASSSVLLCAGGNLLQMLLFSQLRTTHFQVAFPFSTVLLSAALGLLCRYFRRAKAVSDDNQTII